MRTLPRRLRLDALMLAIVFAALGFAAVRTFSVEPRDPSSPSRAIARSVLDARRGVPTDASRMQTDLITVTGLAALVSISAARCRKQLRSRR
jgi:hypothetical protein